MNQISTFSHLKNLFLIGIFSLVANSLLTEIIQIILKELKLSTFWFNYGHWFGFVITVLILSWIFSWFPTYLFPKGFDKIRANNLIFNYSLIMIFLRFLIQILIMFFAPGLLIFTRLFGGMLGTLGNFYLIMLTISAIANVLIVSLIWKTFNDKILIRL